MHYPVYLKLKKCFSYECTNQTVYVGVLVYYVVWY